MRARRNESIGFEAVRHSIIICVEEFDAIRLLPPRQCCPVGSVVKYLGTYYGDIRIFLLCKWVFERILNTFTTYTE